MSGIGVGSKEMRSVLADGGQLESLALMLNDLKLKVAYVTFHHNLIQYTYMDLQEYGTGKP